jgi:hypothetical protein
MERRIALTLAGTAAIVVTVGAAAVAANFGILGVAGAQDDEVGQLDNQNVAALIDAATTTSLPPDVVVIDEYVTVPGAGAVAGSGPSVADAAPEADAFVPSPVVPSAPASGPTATAPASAPRSSAPDDSSYEHEDDEYEDDDYDDDEHEDEDKYDDEHEDEEDHEDD